MRGAATPIFRDHSKTYRADSCEPLVDAVDKGDLQLSAFAREPYPGTKLPKGILPGLLSVGYWDAIKEQEWSLPWHRNEGIELTWLETGSLTFLLGEEEYILKPGDLTITRPWQPLKVGNPNVGAGRLHWIILDVGVSQPHQDWSWPPWLILGEEDMQELTAYLRGNEKPVWESDKEIAGCFRKIAETVSSGEINGKTPRISVYTNELFLHLLDMFHKHQTAVYSSLTTARRSTNLFLDTLESNVGEMWTVEDMASNCGLGVTRFVHYCKEITNQTPLQYLNRLRVKKAAVSLVEDRDKSVTDIAFEHGFSSSQYFATVFKRHFHCSPREYRKKYVNSC